MKLISSKVEYMPQQSVLKQIEAAGRTCYKSEDKITEDSAPKFVDMLKKRGHTAMLEHGTVYLKIPRDFVPHIFYVSPYVHFGSVVIEDDVPYHYFTTNERFIFEHKLEYIEEKYGVEKCEHHIPRITFRITCDRGVSHELVRHRVFSFAQESTRYVSYRGETEFIAPAWWEGPYGTIKMELDESGEPLFYVNDKFLGRNVSSMGSVTMCNTENVFISSLIAADNAYKQLLNLGQVPQQARAVLPNALKTEVVMTGTIDQWEAFLKLRRDKTAHPDMRIIADSIAIFLSEHYKDIVNIPCTECVSTKNN